MSESILRLERASDLAYLNLRCDSSDSDLLRALKKSAGVTLPVAANTIAGSGLHAYWLGPDEWLLGGATEDIGKCQQALESVLRDRHAALNELSGGLVTYRLRGAESSRLLAKGCTLDLHKEKFRAGSCAQTGLAKANVILSPSDEEDGFNIIVRRSFADYVWQWLAHAGRNLGIEVA